MRRLVLVVVGLCAMLPTSRAETYEVKPDGTGDFPTIQAAIDGAVDGDIIELANGTFVGEGNRDVAFYGKALTVRSQSGSPDSCVMDCTAHSGDHHRGFYLRFGDPPEASIEDLTIRNGYMTYGGGGAVYCSHEASTTLSNCVFENNFAEIGGALRCMGDGQVTVINCRFRNNSSGDGHYQGGGICAESCSLTVIDCVFENNIGDSGGGVQLYNARGVFKGCTFLTNTARTLGGAVCANGGVLQMTECTYESNTVSGIMSPRSGGGGVAVIGNTAKFRDCHFTGNSVEFPSEVGYGGGLYAKASPVVLIDCVFRDNAALYGGGLGCEDCDPVLANCTFVGNEAPFGGGGICCDSASPTIYNTILAFNMNGYAVWCLGAENPQLVCCDVYENAGGDWMGCIAAQYGIEGNIREDPQFCDLSQGNLRLLPDSPCAPFSPPNPECDLIGAFPVGCAPQGVSPVVNALNPHTSVRIHPNPTQGATEFWLSLAGDSTIDGQLCIYDSAGRLVREFPRLSLLPGMNSVRWDATDSHGTHVPAGIYYCNLSAGDWRSSARAILLR